MEGGDAEAVAEEEEEVGVGERGEVELVGVVDVAAVFPVTEGERTVVDPPFSPSSLLPPEPDPDIPPHLPAASCASAPMGPPKKDPSLRE